MIVPKSAEVTSKISRILIDKDLPAGKIQHGHAL